MVVNRRRLQKSGHVSLLQLCFRRGKMVSSSYAGPIQLLHIQITLVECLPTSLLFEGFKAASYATVWADKRYGNDTMHRLAMHPVTLFRAQLSAIEDALSQVGVHPSLPR